MRLYSVPFWEQVKLYYQHVSEQAQLYYKHVWEQVDMQYPVNPFGNNVSHIQAREPLPRTTITQIKLQAID